MKSNKIMATRPDNLIEARFSLTTKQNDIIDMILYQIKDDDCYKYEIDIEKFKGIYKMDTSNIYRDLKKAVESFEGKGLEIVNSQTNERVYFHWFSKIHYMNNSAKIFVNLDMDFKKVLLEVKKKIYYDLRYTLNFSGIYSKRLYYYLKSFEDTGWRKDNIDELRKKLECPKSYNAFYDFNRYVLKPAHGEINNNSDISFEYEPIKVGRKIAKIEFRIHPKENNKKQEQLPGELPNDEPSNIGEQEPIEAPNDEQKIEEEKTPVKNETKESPKEEAVDFIERVAKITEGKLSKASIKTLLKVAKNDIEKIREKYILSLEEENIDDLGKWMYSAVKNNYTKEKGKNKKKTFNNHKSRYDDNPDYGEYVKKLLNYR